MVNSALEYLEKYGFSVIPMQYFPPENGATKGKKVPRLKEWKRYQTEKPTPEQVKLWWEKWPDAMVGVVTGKLSGIVSVDVDEEIGFIEIEKHIPDSLLIPTYKTPSGGVQMLFKMPSFDLRVAVRNLPGCDLRAEGGIAILPPSYNASGKYQWLDGLEIGNVDLETLPESYQALSLNNKSTLYRECDDNSQSMSSNVVKLFEYGTRDNDLFHTANCLVKGGMQKPLMRQVLERLIISWGENPDPKWIEAKIESALKRAESRERNLAAEVREWVLSSSGVFLSSDVAKCLQVSSRDDLKNLSKILSRLEICEKYGNKNGQFRKIESEIERVNLFADRTPLDVKIPCGVSELCNLYPKNIIVLAGSKSSGKTAFLLNLVRDNQGKYPIIYLNSEMGDEEFSERIEKFGYPIQSWKFDAIHRHHNFQDLITGEKKIFIIDYLEIHDNFYEVAKPIRLVHEKLKDGICFIAIQKNKNAEVGRGGDFSMEKSRLYMTLDYNDSERCSVLKIVDAKASKSRDGARGMCRKIKIFDGCKLKPMDGWER